MRRLVGLLIAHVEVCPVAVHLDRAVHMSRSLHTWKLMCQMQRSLVQNQKQSKLKSIPAHCLYHFTSICSSHYLQGRACTQKAQARWLWSVSALSAPVRVPTAREDGALSGLQPRPCKKRAYRRLTLAGRSVADMVQVVKEIWAYVKSNNLQNPKDKRKIILDEVLGKIFKVDPRPGSRLHARASEHLNALLSACFSTVPLNVTIKY